MYSIISMGNFECLIEGGRRYWCCWARLAIGMMKEEERRSVDIDEYREEVR